MKYLFFNEKISFSTGSFDESTFQNIAIRRKKSKQYEVHAKKIKVILDFLVFSVFQLARFNLLNK